MGSNSYPIFLFTFPHKSSEINAWYFEGLCLVWWNTRYCLAHVARACHASCIVSPMFTKEWKRNEIPILRFAYQRIAPRPKPFEILPAKEFEVILRTFQLCASPVFPIDCHAKLSLKLIIPPFRSIGNHCALAPFSGQLVELKTRTKTEKGTIFYLPCLTKYLI